MGIDDPSSAKRAACSDTLSITEPSSAKKFNFDDPTHKIDPSDYAVVGIEATARIAAYTLGILGPEIGPSGILAYLSGAHAHTVIPSNSKFLRTLVLMSLANFCVFIGHHITLEDVKDNIVLGTEIHR